jgi:membrane-associated phospholipid phosphatase
MGKCLNKNTKALILLFLVLMCGAEYAQTRDVAADEPSGEPYTSPFTLDLTRELLVFGTAAAMWATGAVIINGLDPLTDEEIYALDPDDVNKFDRGAIGIRRETQAGDTLVSASIFLPLTFLASGATRRDMAMLGVMAVEVLMLNQGLNWMAKGLARRTRPFVYEPESPHEDKTKTNARLSFYSGHTSTAASMTFFTARVFSDYLTSKTAKALIWTAAAVYPALVGYLRRDSANHFRTDVITGYLVGALIGYGVPLLHKSRSNSLSISPAISGSHFHFTVRFSF